MALSLVAAALAHASRRGVAARAALHRRARSPAPRSRVIADRRCRSRGGHPPRARASLGAGARSSTPRSGSRRPSLPTLVWRSASTRRVPTVTLGRPVVDRPSRPRWRRSASSSGRTGCCSGCRSPARSALLRLTAGRSRRLLGRLARRCHRSRSSRPPPDFDGGRIVHLADPGLAGLRAPRRRDPGARPDTRDTAGPTADARRTSGRRRRPHRRRDGRPARGPAARARRRCSGR